MTIKTEPLNVAGRADYVIIGSGSAGAALAYRLGEDGRNTVIVLEVGGVDWGPFIQMPAALSYPMNMKLYDWGYWSEPEPYLDNRRLACPRGKVRGGSSSINGMIYVRGHPLDFDHWEEVGAKGWAFKDVEPYYRRMETWKEGGPFADIGRGDPSVRGSDGPVHVTRGPRKNPLYAAFVEAGRQAGYPVTPDYNGVNQEGVGTLEQTVDEGVRWSVNKAYLKPAKKWPNVNVHRAYARKIIIENGKAIGVEAIVGDDVVEFRANKEVIISASAINSPKLLMLSGIGPAAHLAEHGIDVVADRPGVGSNLQDHLEMYIQQKCIQPVTLYKYWNLWGKALIGAQWLFFKTGLGATNNFESGAFLRSSDDVDYPDVQFHFLPFAVRYDGQAAAGGHGYQIHTGPMRSKARGTVRLKSADPMAEPEIKFNYMSHEDDFPEFRRAIRMAREVFAQDAFTPYRGDEVQPGSNAQTNDELDASIREHAESAYHPCGTCKMGAIDDPMAVVDPDLKVIGVAGLRVVDSSIFPRITNGNLNAPSIMTGEKAADHILGRRLPPKV